jgi:hypothetical protein
VNDLFAILPEDEKIIVDVLRQIIIETLPEYCKEKVSVIRGASSDASLQTPNKARRFWFLGVVFCYEGK